MKSKNLLPVELIAVQFVNYIVEDLGSSLSLLKHLSLIKGTRIGDNYDTIIFGTINVEDHAPYMSYEVDWGNKLEYPFNIRDVLAYIKLYQHKLHLNFQEYYVPLDVNNYIDINIKKTY